MRPRRCAGEMLDWQIGPKWFGLAGGEELGAASADFAAVPVCEHVFIVQLLDENAHAPGDAPGMFFFLCQELLENPISHRHTAAVQWIKNDVFPHHFPFFSATNSLKGLRTTFGPQRISSCWPQRQQVPDCFRGCVWGDLGTRKMAPPGHVGQSTISMAGVFLVFRGILQPFRQAGGEEWELVALLGGVKPGIEPSTTSSGEPSPSPRAALIC